MTDENETELRLRLQQIGIIQTIFREAIHVFERIAGEVGCEVSLSPTDDFRPYEKGVTRKDLHTLLQKYKKV